MTTSSYYYKPVDKTAKERADRTLVKKIEETILEFPGYGYRRVTKHLKRAGQRVNHKRVLRLMREHSLIKRRKRRYVRTTDSRHGYQIYPNLIKELSVTSPNQVWVSDITYIRLLFEFGYLAAILDKYSRRAIGYALSSSIDSRLTLEALEMAIVVRNPSPGCIHHSDRGVQYACDSYVARLERNGFQISMTRKGNPYDNAEIESFFKTLKWEEVYLWEYRTLEDARRRIESFIEAVYNKKRLHSSLGYLPPVEFEMLSQRACEHKKSVDNGQIILTKSIPK